MRSKTLETESMAVWYVRVRKKNNTQHVHNTYTQHVHTHTGTRIDEHANGLPVHRLCIVKVNDVAHLLPAALHNPVMPVKRQCIPWGAGR